MATWFAKRLATDESRSLIQREVEQANAFGIDGVPCFIFNGQTYLPGAQSSEVLAEAIRRVAFADEIKSKT